MSASTHLDPASGGQWLYRKGELVLGPVAAQQIIEKLYAGEIDGKTEISLLEQMDFRPASEVDAFHLHLAKAEAKLRVDEVARVKHDRHTRRRNIFIAAVAGIALIAGGLAAAGARYFAVHNPFVALDISQISVEPPKIAMARARSKNKEDDLIDYPGSHGGGGKRAIARAATFDRSRLPARMSSGAEEPDGMQTAQFDQPAIQSVVASKQKTLYSCFGEEAQRHPGLAGRFPIEFVIGNDGRVSRLWVDHPDYKQGPLADCLMRELQKWPFRPYDGEQAVVALSFNVGRKG
jgi:hypothetical protein